MGISKYSRNKRSLRKIYFKWITNRYFLGWYWYFTRLSNIYINFNNFYDLPNLIEEIHKNNYQFVPIVDLGFPKNEDD